MSGPLVGEVLSYAPRDLRHLDLLVLVALAESANTRDRVARYDVTTEDLADKCLTSPGTIRNALQRLRRRGLIVPLVDKPRKGLAQNYLLPRLTEAHRTATLDPRGRPDEVPRRLRVVGE